MGGYEKIPLGLVSRVRHRVQEIFLSIVGGGKGLDALWRLGGRAVR